MITVVFFSHSLFAVLYPWLLYRLCLGVFPSPFSLQLWRTLRLVWLRFGYDKSKLNSCLVITISTNLRHCNWLQLPEGHVCGLGILVQNSRWSRELKAPSTSKHSEKTQHSTSLIQIVDNPYERGKKISSASFSNQNLFVSVIFSFFPHLWSSSIDALDPFILRVKWSFEVGLGLVRHSHPLQGELAAPYEVGTHLTKKGGERERDGVKNI